MSLRDTRDVSQEGNHTRTARALPVSLCQKHSGDIKGTSKGSSGFWDEMVTMSVRLL